MNTSRSRKPYIVKLNYSEFVLCNSGGSGVFTPVSFGEIGGWGGSSLRASR